LLKLGGRYARLFSIQAAGYQWKSAKESNNLIDSVITLVTWAFFVFCWGLFT
jgi:hypothetical protein